MVKIKSMFIDNWVKIMFSYTLFSINAILLLIYPKVLGNTIDHLINKDYEYVGYLILTFVSFMFFSYLSRIYDTRIFSEIYKKFAYEETVNQIENGIETSKINGRISLMTNVVHFFERDMLGVLQTIYGLIVSLYFISLINGFMVACLIASGICTLIVSYYYSPKLANITKMNNDISEEQTEVISTRDISLIDKLLTRGQILAVKMSNLDAKFSLWIQVIAYGTITALLTFYVMNYKVTVGDVFSTYRYLFEFCIAISGVPMIITSYINIKDVIKRLKTEEE